MTSKIINEAVAVRHKEEEVQGVEPKLGRDCG
jgi:hypothetical protein